MELSERLETFLTGFYGEQSSTFNDQEYQATFSEEGDRKSQYVIDDLQIKAAKFGLTLQEFAFVSIGGSDGSEAEAILLKTPLKNAVLLEMSSHSCEVARKRSEHLKIKEKSLSIYEGDAVGRLEEAIANLVKSKVSGIIFSAQAILHELPTRSDSYKDMNRFLGTLFRTFPKTMLYAREPCIPRDWPKEVEIRIPSVAGDRLRTFLVMMGRHFGQDIRHIQEQPGDFVICDRNLAVEVLHKLLRSRTLAEFRYEMGERLTSFDAEEVRQLLLAFCERPENVAVDWLTTDGFREQYAAAGVEARDPSSQKTRLPVPHTHVIIKAISLREILKNEVHRTSPNIEDTARNLTTMVSTETKSSEQDSTAAFHIDNYKPILVEGTVQSIDFIREKPVATFGRKPQLDLTIAAITDQKHVSITGGPGLGKTTIAVASLFDSLVRAKFGDRRTFVSLEDSEDPRQILVKTAIALGAPPLGDEATILRSISKACGLGPVAIVLDNVESTFNVDYTKSEHILRMLAQVDKLQVITTSRTTLPIFSDRIINILDLPKLNELDSKSAFLAIAGERFLTDENLKSLLSELDGHPLSIDIIGAQAQNLASLDRLLETWQQSKAEILRKPNHAEGRLTSVRASLRLSLSSPLIKEFPFATRLLSVLGLLPAGIHINNVSRLLGGRAKALKSAVLEAERKLREAHLVEYDLDERLRLLTPIRESVLLDVPCIAPDKEQTFKFFEELINKSGTIFGPNFSNLNVPVMAEADNFDSVCQAICQFKRYGPSALSMLDNLAHFANFTGKTSANAVKSALLNKNVSSSREKTAICHLLSAVVSSGRNQHVEAKSALTVAIKDFELLKRPRDLVRSKFSLAEIEKRRSAQSAAVKLLREIIASSSAGLNKGTAYLDLCSINTWRGEYDSAYQNYREAERFLDVKGRDQVSALYTLGELRLYQRKIEESANLFQESLLRSRERGDMRYEGNCAYKLAVISLMQGDKAQAKILFEDAQRSFHSVGGVLSEGKAMVQLVKLGATVLGDADIALQEASKLICGDPDDLALPAWKQFLSSLLVKDEPESSQRREQAAKMWEDIGRRDLIVDFIELDDKKNPRIL